LGEKGKELEGERHRKKFYKKVLIWREIRIPGQKKDREKKKGERKRLRREGRQKKRH